MQNRVSTVRFLALGFLVIGAGCGTIWNGSRQTILVTSQPGGARVFLNGAEMGRTPMALPLRRKLDHEVTLKLDGYKEHTFKLASAPDTLWVVIDLLFFATIAYPAIDVATGNWCSFDFSQVGVELQPVK